MAAIRKSCLLTVLAWCPWFLLHRDGWYGDLERALTRMSFCALFMLRPYHVPLSKPGTEVSDCREESRPTFVLMGSLAKQLPLFQESYLPPAQ